MLNNRPKRYNRRFKVRPNQIKPYNLKLDARLFDLVKASAESNRRPFVAEIEHCIRCTYGE